MSEHQELLLELEGYARSANGVESLMAQLATGLHERKARYNWVGFYLVDGSSPKSLVLGPYAGSFVPLAKISFGAGLCGTAAATKKSVVVNNVAADMRYIARADMVKSEMVVPVLVKNELAAVIDIESYFTGTFTPQDQEFLESCGALVGRFMELRGIAAVTASEAAR
jgi:putative methionine-R-sulfoxide reductase with GAF domain